MPYQTTIYRSLFLEIALEIIQRALFYILYLHPKATKRLPQDSYSFWYLIFIERLLQVHSSATQSDYTKKFKAVFAFSQYTAWMRNTGESEWNPTAKC